MNTTESTNRQRTPCEILGYKQGDWFEVIDDGNGQSDYRKIGMIIKLVADDGSDVPLFEYIGGNTSELVNTVGDKLWCEIESIKPIKPYTETINSKEETKVYTKEQIDLAFTYLKWKDNSKETLFDALDCVTDPEYKKYLELKNKFE